MSTPKDRPPIDRSAPIAEPASPAASAQDAAMPTVENEPGSVFQPGPGITAADVYEVALMTLLEMSNSPVKVAPGALRTVAISAERVGQLSESARRFMQPLATPAVTH